MWLYICILTVDDSINEPQFDENFLAHYLPHSNCYSYSPTLLPSGLSVCCCAITNRNAEIYLSVWAGVSWQVRCLSLLFSGSRFAKQTVKIARTCHVLVAARRREGVQLKNCIFTLCLFSLPPSPSHSYSTPLSPSPSIAFHAPFLNVHLSGSKIV